MEFSTRRLEQMAKLLAEASTRYKPRVHSLVGKKPIHHVFGVSPRLPHQFDGRVKNASDSEIACVHG